LIKLIYSSARAIILDTAEVVTPSCLAISAKDTPWIFTNPIAIRARTLLASRRRLPAFIS